MVAGIESFRNKFRDYADCYTVIGSAACDILMSEENIDFRATKDIDMILIMEDRYPEFASVFWDYISEGGYKCGWKNSDKMHFYRFTDPRPGYPVMIELFSRNPGYNLDTEKRIIPIHIDEDTSSLSAILLDDDFYEFMLEGRTEISNLSVLKAEYIIPFKMCAWLDLKQKKKAGEHVNDRDYKKHKNDVFRLIPIVDVNSRIQVRGKVKEAVDDFLNQIAYEAPRPEQLGLEISFAEAMDALKTIYIR